MKHDKDVNCDFAETPQKFGCGWRYWGEARWIELTDRIYIGIGIEVLSPLDSGRIALPSTSPTTAHNIAPRDR